MKRLFAAIISVTALFFVSACGIPGLSSSSSSPTPKPVVSVGVRDGGPVAPTCAELEAQAASSPNVAVSGSWNCLTTIQQDGFINANGLQGDSGLATYAAAAPVFTHYYSCGLTGTWYYFDLRGNPTNAQMHYSIRFQVNSSGQVSGYQYAPGWQTIDTCPAQSQ